MAKRTAVTITLATLLGVALGGLVLWKATQCRKRKTRCSSQQEEAAVESGDEKLIKAEDKKVLSFFRSPTFFWIERTFGADIVMVSEQEEWDHVEPLLKKELEKWPVLGIDCEWVSDQEVPLLPLDCKLHGEIIEGGAIPLLKPIPQGSLLKL